MGLALPSRRSPWALAWSLTAATLACATVALSAEPAPVSLEWKFEPGLELQYAFPQTTTTEARVGGKDLKTETVSRSEVSLKVVKLDGDDLASGQLTLERMRIEIKAPEVGAFYYDSAGRQRTKGYLENVIAGYDALAKRPFDIVIDRRGELQSVTLAEEYRQRAIEGKAPINTIATPRGLTQFLGLNWPVLPAEPIARGATWEVQEEVANMALGKVQSKRTYKFEGPVNHGGKRLDKFTCTLELAADTKTQRGNLTYKLLRQSNEAAMYFDRAAGRFVEGQSKLQLVLDTNTGSQQFEQTLTTTSGFVLTGAKQPGEK
jgi:hypothetical protein